MPDKLEQGLRDCIRLFESARKKNEDKASSSEWSMLARSYYQGQEAAFNFVIKKLNALLGEKDG